MQEKTRICWHIFVSLSQVESLKLVLKGPGSVEKGPVPFHGAKFQCENTIWCKLYNVLYYACVPVARSPNVIMGKTNRVYN